jgi:V/A-type H+/Na+-transporting ATPase subunit I
MFKPLPMQRIELSLLKDDAPHMALLLAEYGCFNPEISEISPQQLPDLPGEAYRRSHDASRSRLDKILAHYGIAAPDTTASMHAATPEQLEQLAPWLKQIWEQCSEDQERVRKLREDLRRNAQLLKALDQFKDINIDLTLLQKKSSVLDLRVGTLPRANIQRFEEALSLAGYVAIHLFTGTELAHLIIAGPSGQAGEVERVLQAAGWHATDIPAEFQGQPAEVRKMLTGRMAQLEQLLAQEAERLRAAPTHQGLHERLLDAARTLAHAAPYAELSTLMRGRGNLATVSGWIPERQLPRLRQMLQESFGDCFVLQARAPRADERMQVPSLIVHHRWLRPFASLVLGYGVPRYGEIDPTILFAVSFVLMFGMMFGDAGHGAVIALAGLLMRRRLGQYAPMVIAVGISSICFGLLYGSVFGFEHVLPALWMSPLSNPQLMLLVALVWGVGFILLATALTIRNRIADGQLREALIDSRGGTGLLLYLGLLFGGYRFATTGHLGIGISLLICAILAVVLASLWQRNRSIPAGERILVVVMEGFETVMGYISNTLSFMRLAAFSLNHVALSIAIFTVANMLHSTGYWVTVVLGNLFILVLEGGIVAIQTLRLEYYEGFSRFFDGDGRLFRPLAAGIGKEPGF